MPDIYIDTKTKLLEHRLARHIPWKIWTDEFHNQASSRELRYMEASHGTTKLKERASLEKAFICSLIGYKNGNANLTSIEKLLERGRLWRIADAKIGKYAAILGMTDLFDALWNSQYSRRTKAISVNMQSKLLKGDRSNRIGYTFLHTYCAKHGQMQFMQHLETLMTPKQKSQALTGESCLAYYQAAANGHRNIIDHLENSFSDQQQQAAITALNFAAFRGAIEHGHVHIVEHIASKLTPEQKIRAVQTENYEVYRSVAINHELPMLRYLESILPDAEKRAAIEANDFESIRRASSSSDDTDLKSAASRLEDSVSLHNDMLSQLTELKLMEARLLREQGFFNQKTTKTDSAQTSEIQFRK